MGVKESQCLVFAHHKTDNLKGQKALSKALAKVHIVTTSLEQNAVCHCPASLSRPNNS
jgi:hypothetical protein